MLEIELTKFMFAQLITDIITIKREKNAPVQQ